MNSRSNVASRAADELRSMRDQLARLMERSKTDERVRGCECANPDWRIDPQDDEPVCLSCLTARMDSLIDFMRAPRPAAPVAPCPECRNPDGSLNAERMNEDGACLFGCGRRVPTDESGFCPSCHEHSANEYECETCGSKYADWNNGTWAPAA